MLKSLVAISMVMVAAGTTSVAAAGTTSLGAKCPDKFELVSEYCLHVNPGHTENKPAKLWDTARKLCQDLAIAGWSADLVILKDAAKLSIINKLIYANEALQDFAFWVGARQVAVETSPWMWLDDTPVDSNSYMWIPNEPKANTTTNFARLVPASTEPFRLYMSGVDIGTRAPSFVCEAVAE